MICSSVNLFFTSNLLLVGLDSKLRRYSNQGDVDAFDGREVNFVGEKQGGIAFLI